MDINQFLDLLGLYNLTLYEFIWVAFGTLGQLVFFSRWIIQWFSSERKAMQQMIDSTQLKVTGDVRLKIYKGNVIITGRRSPFSKYNLSLVSFDEEGDYDQKDAEGFIKINALRMKNNNKS